MCKIRDDFGLKNLSLEHFLEEGFSVVLSIVELHFYWHVLDHNGLSRDHDIFLFISVLSIPAPDIIYLSLKDNYEDAEQDKINAGQSKCNV